MSQRGKVGITLNCDWGEAKDNSPENLSAQTRYMQWYIGIFAHPIFIGDFPKVMIDMVEKKSEKQGYRNSRLPSRTVEQNIYLTINMIARSAENVIEYAASQ